MVDRHAQKLEPRITARAPQLARHGDPAFVVGNHHVAEQTVERRGPRRHRGGLAARGLTADRRTARGPTQPDPDLTHTIAALRAELGSGPLLYRFSGTQGREGCFVACSFWLVEALVAAGRVDEGEELLEELVALGKTSACTPRR